MSASINKLINCQSFGQQLFGLTTFLCKCDLSTEIVVVCLRIMSHICKKHCSNSLSRRQLYSNIACMTQKHGKIINLPLQTLLRQLPSHPTMPTTTTTTQFHHHSEVCFKQFKTQHTKHTQNAKSTPRTTTSPEARHNATNAALSSCCIRHTRCASVAAVINIVCNS
jgi:hypothetical protein